MPEIDVGKLVRDMASAALGVLKKEYPAIQKYALTEFKKLGETIVNIEQLSLVGGIEKEEARVLIEIQKNAMRSVMLTVEGLGIIAVEQAINAALKAIRETVNKALGWKLI